MNKEKDSIISLKNMKKKNYSENMSKRKGPLHSRLFTGRSKGI